MLINSKRILADARKRGICVPAFNVYNLESIQAVFQANSTFNDPVIIAFGEGYIKDVSISVIAAMVREIDRDFDMPVVLHLDHSKDPEHIMEACRAGFTSVMYDGSHLPFTENIIQTRNIVEMTGIFDVSVEAELGSMNLEDGSQSGRPDLFTDPAAARKFTDETKADSLAVSIGNAHGSYTGDPHIAFERLQEIQREVSIPLVLHGSSGLSDQDILRAVGLGISKININTEIAMAGARGIAAGLTDDLTPRLEQLMRAAKIEMAEAMKKYIDLSRGSTSSRKKDHMNY